MLSALSHVNGSSAILAAKAFMIATGLVAIGGTAFIWTVKEALGVKDVGHRGSVIHQLNYL